MISYFTLLHIHQQHKHKESSQTDDKSCWVVKSTYKACTYTFILIPPSPFFPSCLWLTFSFYCANKMLLLGESLHHINVTHYKKTRVLSTGVIISKMWCARNRSFLEKDLVWFQNAMQNSAILMCLIFHPQKWTHTKTIIILCDYNINNHIHLSLLPSFWVF